ncbi:DUF2637 domain-containing protein [Streptomyces smyrnaeus]|uniref:DUF2637 domain-containing protein n=1 Tax=Streptomyces smyrnaeus TaxID=1387713 RepID=UPI00368E6580
MTHTDAIPVRITGWDRTAIVTLGAAGCALSYDALQQMAVAIHIRGFLTYLFPFVIDGFIGYGVRAVLVMRSAALGARVYVWALFGTATAASIWANALHAVRLNDQAGGGGLRLGDVTVGVLSTLAPLALAGAVHLYILIARRAAQAGQPDPAVTPGTRTAHTERLPATPDSRGARGDQNDQDTVRTVTGHQPSVLSAGAPDRLSDASGDNRSGQSVTDAKAEPATSSADTAGREGRRAVPAGEPVARSGDPAQPAPETSDNGDAGVGTPAPAGDRAADDLLPIARRAVFDAGKLTRKVVADAIRGQGRPLSNDRLTELMQQLREEADNRTLRSTA